MWCPSVSLSVWANAWLAGLAAPDDVLDALSRWAPTQSVTAHDAVAAGHAGLGWPDVRSTGAVSLLQTLRGAPGCCAVIDLALPVPGDVRGLPVGTAFARDALAAGEAVIVTDPGDPASTVGLVPDYRDSDSFEHLSWTVYALPGAPKVDHHDLGAAEYALRSAVRTAAEALGSIGLQAAGNPRQLVEELLESTRAHRIPEHAPTRAVRVLENAAHVDAILLVSSELLPAGTQSSSQAQLAAAALHPLAAVVRSARMAAVSVILRSAGQG